jgi:hypothetical protein
MPLLAAHCRSLVIFEQPILPPVDGLFIHVEANFGYFALFSP